MGRGCGDQTLHVTKPQTTAPEGAAVSLVNLSFASEAVLSIKGGQMNTHASRRSEKTKVSGSSIVRKLVVSIFAAVSFGLVYNSAKANSPSLANHVA